MVSGRVFRALLPLLLAIQATTMGMWGVAAVAAAAIACGPATPSPAVASPEAAPAVSSDARFPDEGGSLTVFAAASLADAFNQIAIDLQEAHPNLTITFQTAGSQSLVTQLQEGARADVLATANTSTMQTAVDSGLIEGDPVPFTGNRLVIVTPKDNPARITSFDDLAKDGVRLVVAGPDVPAGKYAVNAICAHEANGVSGFADAVGANIVSEETDVRSVLAKVQLGEADAGIVYASDAVAAALAGNALNVIDFPASVPTTASYPIAAVVGGNTELARVFIAYVLSPEGQQVLVDYGFEPAG